MLNNWLEPDWPAPSCIRAVSTLRMGGVSQGSYAEFNLADHVGDELQNVLQNRQLLKSCLKLPGDPVWLTQVHSDVVVQAELNTDRPSADASFTACSNVVCVVMTADCLPVLFCSMDGQVVAAAHAGWRGLLAGILRNTYQAMRRDNVIAWLGPAIGPQCFEVGNELFEAFTHKDSRFSMAFSRKDPQHYLADLYELARIELAMCGVTEVFGGDFCTYSEPERFFSYRREAKTGRMATLIWRT